MANPGRGVGRAVGAQCNFTTEKRSTRIPLGTWRLGYRLPEAPAGELQDTQALLEAVRLEANTRPRAGLEDCSPAEMFYAGPRLRVARPTRAAIFASLCDAAWGTFEHMKNVNQRSFATAWRLAAQSWLRGQALISVSAANQNQPTNDQNNQLLLPLFSEQWPH